MQLLRLRTPNPCDTVLCAGGIGAFAPIYGRGNATPTFRGNNGEQCHDHMRRVVEADAHAITQDAPATLENSERLLDRTAQRLLDVGDPLAAEALEVRVDVAKPRLCRQRLRRRAGAGEVAAVAAGLGLLAELLLLPRTSSARGESVQN